jgi:hypothetical protein
MVTKKDIIKLKNLVTNDQLVFLKYLLNPSWDSLWVIDSGIIPLIELGIDIFDSFNKHNYAVIASIIPPPTPDFIVVYF